MNNKVPMSDNIKNILLLTFLLFLGIVAVLAARAIMNMQTEGILVGILFGPLLAYAILFSGRLQELTFGSFMVRFRAVAQEMVSPYSGEIMIGPDLKALQKVGEEGIAALESMLAEYNLSEAPYYNDYPARKRELPKGRNARVHRKTFAVSKFQVCCH
jgi:hypothetical protein